VTVLLLQVPLETGKQLKHRPAANDHLPQSITTTGTPASQRRKRTNARSCSSQYSLIGKTGKETESATWLHSAFNCTPSARQCVATQSPQFSRCSRCTTPSDAEGFIQKEHEPLTRDVFTYHILK
jgi:hypothetical protein